MFTVVFERQAKNVPKMSGEMSGEIGEQILHIIRANAKITIPELAERLNRTSRTIERQIQKLKEAGSIIRIGSTKAGYWEVK